MMNTSNLPAEAPPLRWDTFLCHRGGRVSSSNSGVLFIGCGSLHCTVFARDISMVLLGSTTGRLLDVSRLSGIFWARWLAREAEARKVAGELEVLTPRTATLGLVFRLKLPLGPCMRCMVGVAKGGVATKLSWGTASAGGSLSEKEVELMDESSDWLRAWLNLRSIRGRDSAAEEAGAWAVAVTEEEAAV